MTPSSTATSSWTRLFVLASLLLVATGARAFVPPADDQATRASDAFSVAEIHVEPSLETRTATGLSEDPAFSAFFARHSDRWEIRWDRRNDRPHLIQGAGIPVIPGPGNDLTAAGLGLRDFEPTLDEVEAAVRRFLRSTDILGIADLDFVLDEGSSGLSGLDRQFWTLELQQYHEGVPVHDAEVFFRISHGNIVQFGAEKTSAVTVPTTPTLGLDEAQSLAFGAVGLERSAQTKIDGELILYPTMGPTERRGESYRGLVGRGYDHRLVWRLTFHRDGGDDQSQLLIDAHSGEILGFLDLTLYAHARGSIYPTTHTDPLESVGLPYLKLDVDGTEVVTDADGSYTASGSTVTATLDGLYTTVVDECGSSSLSGSPGSDLDFGGSSDTDCATPGYGGDGNTNAARNSYYHLARMNRKAASYLPNNTWVENTVVTARVNRSQLRCNAAYGGNNILLFLSGGSCANSGDIADVILHEWGHGLDSSEDATVYDRAAREATADIIAALDTRDGCIGEDFYSSSCRNCRSSCTGGRDLVAFAIGGTSEIAHPSKIEASDGLGCSQSTCPFYNGTNPYYGPMGYQGYCESYIASTAVWDVAQQLVNDLGADEGWATSEDLWYKSLYGAESAYRVASGGQCNPSASVDGCDSGNWYTVMLAADDDDGDLSNGTPNGCRIWDAFDAHGIACGDRPACFPVEPTFGSRGTDERLRTKAISGYNDPIVAIGAPSSFGSDPGVVRIQDVTSQSFTHSLQEWDYLDGLRPMDTVGYLVVESGRSTFAGLDVQAGRASATNAGWVTVPFDGSFESPPAVLVTVASANGPRTVTARVRNVGTSSFEVRLQLQEAWERFIFPIYSFEDVHWIAIERGTGTYDGHPVYVSTSTVSVTDQWRGFAFGATYSNPVWIGTPTTFYGSDTASLRYRNLTSTGIEVRMQEETSYDSETGHAAEAVSYIVIARD